MTWTKKLALGGAAALLVVAGSTAAVAKPKPTAGQSARAVKTRYKRQMRVRFGDDVVRGSRATGGGTLITSHRGARQSHLVVVRPNFLPELIKSAEQI